MGFYNYKESDIFLETELHTEVRIPNEIPPGLQSFIKKHLKGFQKEIFVVESHLEESSFETGSLSCLIVLPKLNDFSDPNLFFSNANQSLEFGNLLIGSVETYKNRKERIAKKHAPLFAKMVYAWDTVVLRVIPKLPLIGKLHYMITKGKGKLMSDVEAMGRLYAAGFELIDQTEIDSKLYFVARKSGSPIKNNNSTYWPIVKLNRVGKGGEEFLVYKFRTMYPYSEYLQDVVYQQNNLTDGGKFKDDFRISRFGKFLRKFWLDELPMVWNLLKSDIKLVGVRPLSKQYFNLYHAELKEKRTQFKPGLIPPYYADMPKTLEEIMESEMRYLEAYSNSPIATDFKYFFKILKNILFKGARSR